MNLRADVTFDFAGMKLVPAKLDAALQVGLAYSAVEVREALDRKIAESPRGGHVYYSRRGDGTLHEASAPGVAFAEDTGETQNEIKMFLENLHQNEVAVGWEGKKASEVADLEFGTNDGRVAPRPTVTPVAIESLPVVQDIVGNWLKDLMK